MKAIDIKKHVDRADFGGIISLNTNPNFTNIGQHKSSDNLFLRKQITEKLLSDNEDGMSV